MGDEYDEVASRLIAGIREDLDECTTEACRKARAEAETVYQKVIKEGDMESLKELKGLRGDIGKLLEEIEKARTAPVEHEECPNCHYKGDEKPKNKGRCPNGCTKFNEWDQELGYKHCVVCGEEIDWEEEE